MSNKALQKASDWILKPGLAFSNLEKPAEKTSADSSPSTAANCLIDVAQVQTQHTFYDRRGEIREISVWRACLYAVLVSVQTN